MAAMGSGVLIATLEIVTQWLLDVIHNLWVTKQIQTPYWGDLCIPHLA